MNPAELAIGKRTFALFTAGLLMVAGVYAYFALGRLEDPEYTLKTALVVASYPGANAYEVEEQVTDSIEETAREMCEVDKVRSISRAGLSVVYVDIKDRYVAKELPQIWDKLRKKVADVRPTLPPGVRGPVVNDDFGDVFGVLLAVTGDGYSYAELKDYVDMLQRELELVEDVSKVEIWGEQEECVYVEISNTRLAELGILPKAIFDALQVQNLMADAGSVDLRRERIRIAPTGEFGKVEEIGNLVVRGYPSQRLIRLRDIAAIKRGYVSPPRQFMRFGGRPAIALAASSVPGGNVIRMGDALQTRLGQLMAHVPIGIEIGIVSYQPNTVEKSVNQFVLNLAEAIVIVLATLLVAMGLRSGLLIGSGLVMTILVTLVVMHVVGINLQRVSLGSMIIALGMLVDNSIVVAELMLVKIQKGADRLDAARQAVSETGWPLLGATLIAACAFLAIYISEDVTGEYCRSLFIVVAISLLASWVLAITVTPLICYLWLRIPKEKTGIDPYAGEVFQAYKRLLLFGLGHRWPTIGFMILLLAAAMLGFGHVERAFFPKSTRTQFMVDYWLPEGSRIGNVAADLAEVETFVLGRPGVRNVAAFIGSGPPRFYLPMEPELPNPCFGELIVNTETIGDIDPLMAEVRAFLAGHFPHAEPRVRKFPLGPPDKFKIEARFRGPDPNVLRRLADQAKAILDQHDEAFGVRDDWRQRVKTLVPDFYQPRATRAAVSRYDMALSLKRAFDGLPIGIYRENDKLLPIIARPPKEERGDIGNIDAMPIWGSASPRSVPLSQLISGISVQWEDAVVWRWNRQRTITVQSDVRGVQASELLGRVRPEIEALDLPPGYGLEWGGEHESSTDAQKAVFAGLPLCAFIIVIIIVGLFNAIRQPLIIILTVPLAIIGITAGLLLTHQPFGFMALLGALSLSGMIIKNAVVLIDQIDSEIGKGKAPCNAVIDSSVARMRPVVMASMTTVLGMTPLAFASGFWPPMAVTIMFGLTFATLLTLFVVPILYTLFFRIRPGEMREAAA